MLEQYPIEQHERAAKMVLDRLGTHARVKIRHRQYTGLICRWYRGVRSWPIECSSLRSS
jgi:hypothetical protein